MSREFILRKKSVKDICGWLYKAMLHFTIPSCFRRPGVICHVVCSVFCIYMPTLRLTNFLVSLFNWSLPQFIQNVPTWKWPPIVTAEWPYIKVQKKWPPKTQHNFFVHERENSLTKSTISSFSQTENAALEEQANCEQGKDHEENWFASIKLQEVYFRSRNLSQKCVIERKYGKYFQKNDDSNNI